MKSTRQSNSTSSQLRPRVSVILPAYNTAKYLQNTLRSLRDQSEKSIEVIVVNDGSTDKTREIAEKFVKKDTRFHLINQVNGGLSNARNTGFKQAIGEYVIFLDSDDIFLPELIKRLYDIAQKMVADVAICNFKTYDESAQCVSDEGAIQEVSVGEGELFNALGIDPEFSRIDQFAVMVWNKLYRREFLLEHGIIFDENIYRSEDMLFTTKVMACASRIVYINETLIQYRVNVPGSNVSTMEKYPYEIVEKTLPTIYAYLKDRGMLGAFEKSFYNLAIGAVFSVLYNTEKNEVHEQVYRRAKHLLQAYGAKDRNESYYFNDKHHDLSRLLVTGKYTDWLKRRVAELRDDEGRRYEKYLLSEFKRKFNEELTLKNQQIERILELESRLNSIYGSVSWKVTKPLRGVRRLIKKGVR